MVHRRSSGIPRLINVLCNRALLGAYANNVREVDRALVDTAAKEFSGRPRRTIGLGLRRASWVMLAAGIAVASFTVGHLWDATREEPPPERNALRTDPRTTEGVDRVPAVALAPPTALSHTALEPLTESFAPALDDASVLDALLPLNTPGMANAAVVAATLEAWRLEPIVADSLTFPELFDALTASNLAALPITEGDFDELRRAGLPAILQLKTRDDQLRPVLLRRIEGTRAFLRGILPGETVRTSLAEIEMRWRGDAYAIWHDYAGLPGFIEIGDFGPTVEWLQRALAQTGHFSGIPDGGYGEKTREAVRAFQIATNIPSDGRVGPLTKIRLYQTLGDHAPPALIAEPPAPIEP
jgi:general secretion pathway protein A